MKGVGDEEAGEAGEVGEAGEGKLLISMPNTSPQCPMTNDQ